MLFIETPIFTSEIQLLLQDEYYRNLQGNLAIRPDAGNIITGSGGLRKLRFGLKGIGKRGGLRIIYYWDPPDTLYMLFAYKKNKQEDLTKSQIKILSKLVQEYLK
ncbi:MAG TPA: type II toxin-antitoxin system RelE/ParE family toxin [Bacteroidales bacterium]|nr:type II toxin-antitoxin system RelE/ParE family toxin [Bacteroidales bacterium]